MKKAPTPTFDSIVLMFVGLSSFENLTTVITFPEPHGGLKPKYSPQKLNYILSVNYFATHNCLLVSNKYIYSYIFYNDGT